MELEEELKQIEKSANQLALDWVCVHCEEKTLKYIPPRFGDIDSGKYDYGIEYKCESCGSINQFEEVKEHVKNKF